MNALFQPYPIPNPTPNPHPHPNPNPHPKPTPNPTKAMNALFSKMRTEDLPLETVPLHAALCPAPQPCPSRAPLAVLCRVRGNTRPHH